eukprot:scaffold2373_cov53-Attheya_sp.AAC.2
MFVVKDVIIHGSKILSGLREFSLLHSLAHVPVDKGAFAVHEVKLVVDAGKCLGNGRVVGNHADSALDLGQVSAGHLRGRLSIDTALESGGAPVHKLDRSVALDGAHGAIDLNGHDVSAVHETTAHVLAAPWVAASHHGDWVREHSIGELGNRVLLVEGLGVANERRVGRHEEVDARVGHERGGEVVHVNVERSVKAQRHREGGDHLRNETIEVGEGGALNVQALLADVVERLVVQRKGQVRVLEQRVGGEHGVVGLHHGGGHGGGGGDREGHLGLAAKVDREALEEKRAEARSGAAARGVEDEESLQAAAVVGNLADAVHGLVHNVLADGVVSASVVIGRVLLAVHDGVGVVQAAVGAVAHLVADGGLQVQEQRAGHHLSRLRLAEERVVGARLLAGSVVGGHASIGLDAVLVAVKLPTGVSHLDACLAHMDAH